MKLSLRSLLAPSLALSLCLTAPQSLAQENADAKNWQMFAHFVNVARPEQAQPFGKRLLELSNEDFLAAVESNRIWSWEKVGKIGVDETLKPTWQAIQDKYQKALTERSRDVDQIKADIQALGKGRTAEYLAIQRLKNTGQFAAPYYLEVLQDATQSRLHPRVVNAMVEVGAELTYPLAVALPYLDPSTQVKICGVVGEIGYPEALPYLKLTLQNEPNVRVAAAANAAFAKIADTSGYDATGSAADIFVRIGQAKYTAGTRGLEILGMDLGNKQGIIWRYQPSSGLFKIAVDQKVYADSLAMQNAASALKLNPEMAQAVTLHLTANLRRENTLAGAKDPGYTLPNPATFYLLLAGASQQKTVLTIGLTERNTGLALDAIEAMAKTVGDNVLLGSDDAKTPVLDALFFADRRVRFTSAITLASAAPAEAFAGSASVVPVLGQAIRQTDELNAIVVGANHATNASAMESIDYKAVQGPDVSLAATSASASMPGVDLIVYSGDLAGFEAMYAAAQADGMLRVIPILALVNDGVASAIKLSYPNVITAAPLANNDEDELNRLERLSTQTIQAYGGDPIGGDEAEGYAVTAVDLLKTIAGHESIYNASDVEPILIEALDDNRAKVATGSGEVLELMDSATAQQGLADAALTRVGDVQVALLDALAESAKSFGNKLSRATIDKLIALVDSAKGETALAAARALGALTERPTSDTTGFILNK